MDWNEFTNVNEYAKLFIGLVAISTPLAAVPVYLSYAAGRPKSEQSRIALATAVVFAVTLILFTFLGRALLDLFGISISAFQVAGGVILLMAALQLMRGDTEDAAVSAEEHEKDAISIAVVPLAIPLLAGPGAISTIMIYAYRHDSFSHKIVVSIVVLMTALVIYALLRGSLVSDRWFTGTSVVVLARIMGLIIAAIALEFILSGTARYFQGFLQGLPSP